MGKTIPTWNSEPTPGRLTIDGDEIPADQAEREPLTDTTADRERAAQDLNQTRTWIWSVLPPDPIIQLMVDNTELHARIEALTNHLLDGASTFEQDGFRAVSDDTVSVALLERVAALLGGTSVEQVA